MLVPLIGLSPIGTKDIIMHLEQQQICNGFIQSSSNKCRPGNTFLIEVPDVAYGEVFGEAVTPDRNRYRITFKKS